MKKLLSKYATMVFMILAIFGCSIPGTLSSEPSSTQTAAANPPESATAASTATETPSPTSTSTPSITPTATPLPFVYELQDDGTTMVTDPPYGYGFVLPQGWEVTSPRLNTSPESRIFASNESSTASSTELWVSIDTDHRNLDTHLEDKLYLYGQLFDFTIQRQGQMTNSRGTTLGYVEYSGEYLGSSIHTYEVYFLSDAGMVELEFHDELDGAWGAIHSIVDSVYLLNP